MFSWLTTVERVKGSGWDHGFYIFLMLLLVVGEGERKGEKAPLGSQPARYSGMGNSHPTPSLGPGFGVHLEGSV